MKKILLITLATQIIIFAVTDKELINLEEKSSVNNAYKSIEKSHIIFNNINATIEYVKDNLHKEIIGSIDNEQNQEFNQIKGYIFFKNKKIQFFKQNFLSPIDQNIIQVACTHDSFVQYIIVYYHLNNNVRFGRMEYFPHFYKITKKNIEENTNEYSKKILGTDGEDNLNYITFNLSDSSRRFPYYTKKKLLNRLIETSFCKEESFISIIDRKVEYSLAKIEKNLKQKKDLKTYNKEFFQNLLPKKPIEKKTLTPYNNIAYYLQKAGANEEAVYLLEKIIEKFPKRTVAYYNLADAYWAMGDKKRAIKAYKTYIKQMKAKGKEKRIPKVVKQRVSGK